MKNTFSAMAWKPHIVHTCKCGVCPFETNSPECLDAHIQSIHRCACGGVFLDKSFHHCEDEEQEFQVGSGLVSIPVDAQGNPVFKVGNKSYKDTVITYFHNFKEKIPDIIQALKTIENPLLELVTRQVNLNHAIRLKFSVDVVMYSPKEGKDLVRFYPSKPFIISHVNYVREQIFNCTKYLNTMMEIMSQEISGLILREVRFLQVTILKFNGLRAEGHLPLGEHFQRKRGLLNMKINNGQCFAYSVAACIYYKNILSDGGKNLDEAKGYDRQKLQRSLEMPEHFQAIVNDMTYTNACYGENLDMVDVYEESNNTSVSILRYCDKSKSVVPVRLTKVFKIRHAFLLLISKEELKPSLRRFYTADLHFVAILNPVSFLAVKSKRYNGVCRFCFCLFKSPTHEKRCFENELGIFTLPKTQFYRFNDHHKLTVPPFFFVYSFLYGGSPDDVRIVGFSLVGLNADWEIIYSRTHYGKDSLDIFFDELLINGQFYLKQMSVTQLPLRPTQKSIQALKDTKYCPICGVEPSISNRFVQHHSHFSSLLNGEKVEGHAAGNPSLILCNNCNLLVKERRRIMVYGYGISKHVQIFLKHVNEHAIKRFSITPLKSAEKYGSLLINRTIQIVDLSNHFSGSSLHSIMREVDDDDLQYLRTLAKTFDEFKIFRNGLAFPSFTDAFPSFENFVDMCQLNDFTARDYSDALHAFRNLGCTTLEEYAKIVLQVDSYALSSLLVNYAKFAMKTFSGISPMYDISIGSFSFSALHYICKSRYKTLDDPRIIKAVESSLLPGISVSNIRHQRFRNPDLGDKCEDGKNSYCLHVDVKSQYNALLRNPLPVDEYKYWDDTEIKQFDFKTMEDTEEINYMVKCSLIYDDINHDFSNDLPLAYCRLPSANNITEKHGNKHDRTEEIASTLDLSLRNKKNIWLSLKNLKLFVSLGLKIEDITGIISFKVSRHLAPFAEACISARQTAKNSFYGHISKVIANVAVGKFIQKRNNVRVTIPSSQRAAERLIANSLFVDAFPIRENVGIFYMQRKKSLPPQNSLICWSILQQSSYQLYDLIYNHLKRMWGNRVFLLYANTDSAIVKISNVENYHNDLAKISHIFDLNTAPRVIPFDRSENKQSDFGVGRWKFESFYVREFVSLRAKSYSLLEECPTCSHNSIENCSSCHKLKGIQLQKVSHEQYKSILHQQKAGIFSFKSLKHDIEGRVKVSHNSRTFLSQTDGGRVWISPNESLAIGHYSLRV